MELRRVGLEAVLHSVRAGATVSQKAACARSALRAALADVVLDNESFAHGDFEVPEEEEDGGWDDGSASADDDDSDGDAAEAWWRNLNAPAAGWLPPLQSPRATEAASASASRRTARPSKPHQPEPQLRQTRARSHTPRSLRGQSARVATAAEAKPPPTFRKRPPPPSCQLPPPPTAAAALRPTLRQQTLYDVLGVKHASNGAEVRRAYRALALKLHPDKNKGVAADQFLRVKEAYTTLSDPRDRVEYDRTLRARTAAT